MAMQSAVLKHQQAAFGRNTETTDNLEAQMIKRVLRRRQCEKIRSYERIASRLEMRGEKDAAGVLLRAAKQLRSITAEAV